MDQITRDVVNRLIDDIKEFRLEGGFESWSYGAESPFELKPSDYMKSIDPEFKEDDQFHLINALSNIKRAIDCRMEEILWVFGLRYKAKKEEWRFGKKVEVLLEVGVVAPRILTKINKRRNELEHEFKKPPKELVEDYYDVANLFLLYTDRFVSRNYDDLFFEGEKEVKQDIFTRHYPRLFVKLFREESKFELTYYENPDDKEGKIFIVTLADWEEYLELLAIWSDLVEYS